MQAHFKLSFIMFANVLLAKATHMAKPRCREWKNELQMQCCLAFLLTDFLKILGILTPFFWKEGAA